MKKTCAIMQPTYFPWAGYFNLIHSVDCFVFLDDVQLDKRSWQTRNRIVENKQDSYLILPIEKCKRETNINEVFLSSDILYFQEKSFKRLLTNYSKSAYGLNLLNDLEFLFKDNLMLPKSLSEYNIEIIKFLCKKMGIESLFYLSSEFDFLEKRTDYLIKILDKLECTHYLSPQGSKAYLMEDKFCEKTEVELLFQEYEPKPYLQYGTNEFISHLSIIDVIANLGYDKASEYCQYGDIKS